MWGPHGRGALPGGSRRRRPGGRIAGEPARRQNPYSKVFAPVLQYSLFEVRGDTCAFPAKTPDGKVLDRLTFRARRRQ